MAKAFATLASINAWLGLLLPLDQNLDGDQVAFQASQDRRANEWRVHWGPETGSTISAMFERVVQIDRARADGDEMALEQELAAVLVAMELDQSAAVALVPVNDYPDAPGIPIDTARVMRLEDRGWERLPDLASRATHLRATLSLRIEYPA